MSRDDTKLALVPESKFMLGKHRPETVSKLALVRLLSRAGWRVGNTINSTWSVMTGDPVPDPEYDPNCSLNTKVMTKTITWSNTHNTKGDYYV